MQPIINSLKITAGKLTVFTGRSSRTEYWTWTLALITAWIAFGVFVLMVDMVLGTSFSSFLSFLGFGLFFLFLAVGWRRMQDTGKPGWLILLGLVPCIGAIAVIVLCCLPSQPGTNQFGPNPYGA